MRFCKLFTANGGGGGAKVKGTGLSKKIKKKIKIKPQLLEWTIRVTSASEDNLSGYVYEGLKLKYTGKGLTELEKKITLHTSGRVNMTNNVRATYVVTFTPKASGGSKPEPKVIIFTIVVNTNNSQLQMHKIGTPTSKLPDENQEKAILQRLNKYNIKLLYSWKDDHRKITLTGLNLLSDKELEKMRDLKIRRKSVPDSGSSNEDGSKVGGQYSQGNHTVTMFDVAFKHSPIMAYGIDPSKMYPAGVHAVIHEAGHAIVYSQGRLAYNKAKNAKKNYDSDLRNYDLEYQNMLTQWSMYFQETNAQAGSYKYDFPTDVPQNDRPAYSADLKKFNQAKKTLKEASKQAKTASKGKFDVKDTKAYKRFKKVAGKLTPTTPYGKKHKDEAKNDNQKAQASEEFLVESFAIYKWDSAWLKTYRRAVYNYFNQNQHL